MSYFEYFCAFLLKTTRKTTQRDGPFVLSACSQTLVLCGFAGSGTAQKDRPSVFLCVPSVSLCIR